MSDILHGASRRCIHRPEAWSFSVQDSHQPRPMARIWKSKYNERFSSQHLQWPALQSGLPRRLTQMLSQTYLGTQILAIIVLCLAKCSNVALMTRVFSFNRGRRDRVYVGCCALQTLNLLWAVSSIAALASCCDPALLLTVSTQCSTRVSCSPRPPSEADMSVADLG